MAKSEKKTKSARQKMQMVYIGSTANKDNKLCGVWVPIKVNDGSPLKLDGLSDDRTIWFSGPKLRKGHAGHIREFEFEENDGKVSIYGEGKYSGHWKCKEEAAIWDAEDIARKTARDVAKNHRNGIAHSKLKEYLRPLTQGYMRCASRDKKAAYLANIIAIVQDYGA